MFARIPGLCQIRAVAVAEVPVVLEGGVDDLPVARCHGKDQTI